MNKHKTIVVAMMMLVTMLSAATITINWNYTGAPPNTTRATDAQGNLMGEPLPAPTRTGQVFTGWFTATTGGSRVLLGANGTKFTSDATIYARWSTATTVNMSSIPAAMKENFDWLKNVRHVREPVLFGRLNLIFDQIWRGGGSINYAVRWESDRVVTLAERQAIARMLHDEINKWTHPLIGMESWPYQEIPVKVIGWAVSSADLIRDVQPNETIWVNNDAREPRGTNHETLMASAPDNISRFVNFTRVNAGTYSYPGGLQARYDMYLWATKGFGGGAGGDWGARMSDATVISVANGGNSTIITHEVGHGFGLYDFYGAVGTDRPIATTVADATGNKNFNAGELRTVMVAGGGAPTAPLGLYDQWQIRYYWDWVKAGSPNSRFQTYPVTVVSAGATGAIGDGNYAAGNTILISAGTRSGYTFNGWTTTSTGVTFANASSEATTFFAMPSNAVTVTANWTAVSPTIPTQLATANISAYAVANTIILENLPQGAKVELYSLNGKRIYSANSENSNMKIGIQAKGMYVVKVNRIAFSIRVM